MSLIVFICLLSDLQALDALAFASPLPPSLPVVPCTIVTVALFLLWEQNTSHPALPFPSLWMTCSCFSFQLRCYQPYEVSSPLPQLLVIRTMRPSSIMVQDGLAFVCSFFVLLEYMLLKTEPLIASLTSESPAPPRTVFIE